VDSQQKHSGNIPFLLYSATATRDANAVAVDQILRGGMFPELEKNITTWSPHFVLAQHAWDAQRNRELVTERARRQESKRRSGKRVLLSCKVNWTWRGDQHHAIIISFPGQDLLLIRP
jgi:hypothetical protein